MLTSNEQILDKYIKHQIYLIQYSDGVSDEAVKLLKATEASLNKVVLYYATKLEGKSLVTKQSRDLMKQLATEVADVRSGAWAELGAFLTRELTDLAVDEAEFASKVITDALPVNINLDTPSRSDLKALATQTPYQGKILSEWITSGRKKDVERIVETTKIGLRLREPATQIVTRVMGTSVAKYRDGAARKAWSGTEALIYTATNSTQAESRTAFNNVNAFLITKEKFVATLDGGTTPICMKFDGEIFDINKGPQPSLHWRCRSLRVPYITDESLGPRSFDPSTERSLVKEYADSEGLGRITGRKRGNLPHGHKTKFDAFARKRRRELVGSVPDKMTYSQWLTNQSKDFQEEVLGVQRAALFRKGDLPLSKFVNRRGNFLTLEQLRAKGIS